VISSPGSVCNKIFAPVNRNIAFRTRHPKIVALLQRNSCGVLREVLNDASQLQDGGSNVDLDHHSAQTQVVHSRQPRTTSGIRRLSSSSYCLRRELPCSFPVRKTCRGQPLLLERCHSSQGSPIGPKERPAPGTSECTQLDPNLLAGAIHSANVHE